MPATRPPAPAPRVRRRALIAGASVGPAALALALSGCSTEPIERLTGLGGADEPAAPAADVDLVDDMRAAVAACLAEVDAAIADAPALAERLADLTALHRTHLDLLDGAVERDDASSAPPPASSAAPSTPASGARSGGEALRAVRRGEAALSATLVAGAERAESGALARLLAAMTAGLDQRLGVIEGVRS